MTAIDLVTPWQAGRAYIMRMRFGHCHNEEDYMPPLRQFCLRACNGNHKQAEDLLSCSACLAAQWLRHLTGCKEPTNKFIFQDVVPFYQTVAGDRPHTFGAALSRALSIAEKMG